MNVTQTMISWVRVKEIHPPHAASARKKLGIQSRKPSINKTFAMIGRFDIRLNLRKVIITYGHRGFTQN